jgi:putative SOS response-associated peptidase YedK
MCYHKSLTTKLDKLAEYYSCSYDKVLDEIYSPRYHENGFDFHEGPVLTTGKPAELQMFHWGLVPYWVKDFPSAARIRTSTLNCISEEMFEKPSFRDAAKEGKRCLIPCTGFYEWRWIDEKGKTKIPYYIYVKDQPLFSIGGLYSKWKDRDRDSNYFSYTVLTTKANKLMSEIHNSKQRMPVIIPREYEKDWLNPNLTNEDVLALCQPIDDSKLETHTISKLITTKGAETNVKGVMEPFKYDTPAPSGSNPSLFD